MDGDAAARSDGVLLVLVGRVMQLLGRTGVLLLHMEGDMDKRWGHLTLWDTGARRFAHNGLPSPQASMKLGVLVVVVVELLGIEEAGSNLLI